MENGATYGSAGWARPEYDIGKATGESMAAQWWKSGAGALDMLRAAVNDTFSRNAQGMANGYLVNSANDWGHRQNMYQLPTYTDEQIAELEDQSEDA